MRCTEKYYGYHKAAEEELNFFFTVWSVSVINTDWWGIHCKHKHWFSFFCIPDKAASQGDFTVVLIVSLNYDKTEMLKMLILLL